MARQSSIEDEEDDEEYMRKASLGRDGAPEDDSFKHGLKKDLKKTIHMDLAADSNGNIQSIKPKRIGLDQIQSVRGSFSYGKRESVSRNEPKLITKSGILIILGPHLCQRRAQTDQLPGIHRQKVHLHCGNYRHPHLLRVDEMRRICRETHIPVKRGILRPTNRLCKSFYRLHEK